MKAISIRTVISPVHLVWVGAITITNCLNAKGAKNEKHSLFAPTANGSGTAAENVRSVQIWSNFQHTIKITNNFCLFFLPIIYRCWLGMNILKCVQDNLTNYGQLICVKLDDLPFQKRCLRKSFFVILK